LKVWKIMTHLYIKIKRLSYFLIFFSLLSALGFSQAGALSRPFADYSPSDWLGLQNYLILTPDLAAASMNRGYVTIPFAVTNNSGKNILLMLPGGQIDGLGMGDQAGKTDFVEDFQRSEPIRWSRSGSYERIILKPGETISHNYSSEYPVGTLGAVTGMKIFGVISGCVIDTKKWFVSYSSPFLVPPELTTLPYNDLGAQNFLSITPDLTKIGFTGGNFKITTLELQRADPHYADSVKNGWAEDLWIPITVTNTSNQDVIAANDEIRFYIAGDEEKKNAKLRDERWEYLKASTTILKPGESCESTGRDYITLRFLEDEGYKPGDKIIAMVGGRIPGTNKIFECYSAPFELPPLPNGRSPEDKTTRVDKIIAEMEGRHPATSSVESQPSTSRVAVPAGQTIPQPPIASQPAPQPPIEPEAIHQRPNWVWYIVGAALLAGIAAFFVKRSRRQKKDQNE
jgi:hypothetical protein